VRRVAALVVLLAACSGAGPVTTGTTAPPAAPTTTAAPGTTTTTGPAELGPVVFAFLGPDGLVLGDGEVLLPGPIEGRHALARDHAGGVAYLAEGVLWWLPAGATEPSEVGAAPGDALVEVVPTDSGPVARLGVCPSRFVSLADGSEVAEPDRVAVEVDCGDPALDRATRRAANGLAVEIAGPDSDGLPQTLEVTQDGAIVVSIPVGGFYEDRARIHDFDGRAVIVSRGTADQHVPETFFVIDLASGDLVRWSEGVHTQAALLTPDVTTVPPVPEEVVHAVYRGTPLRTDDLIASLEDGVYAGYVDYAATSGLTGGPEIHLDLIVWFMGREAGYAATEDGEEWPPGDFYVRNEDPTQIVLPVSPDVEVTSVWFHYDATQQLENRPITYEEFVTAMTGEPVGAEMNMLSDPWWVTVRDGRVVAIHEQYVP
jgi:hypothetical protein